MMTGMRTQQGTRTRTPVEHAIWAARMAWAVSRIYSDAVRETWRRQIALANTGIDALFIYAIRDAWDQTHLPPEGEA